MQALKDAFSFKGRAGRLTFWLTSLAVFMGLIVSVSLTYPFQSLAVRAVAVLSGLVLEFFSIWLSLAVTVRRGHDRRRPAPWSIGLLVVQGLLGLIRDHVQRDAQTAVWLILLVIACYALADYGLLPGRKDANRYGDAPRRSRPARGQ